MARTLAVDFAHRFASDASVSVSLTSALTEGHVVVVFGPSGAGKTTLLRALAGLLKPAAGRIAFAGSVWFDAATDQFVAPRDRDVGYVAQDAALFPHLTVKANVEYGLRRARDRAVRSSELLSLVRVAGLAGRLPRELSGGETERVALARALARRPQLLLLDEPFAALDVPTRRVLRTELRDLLQRTGTSAILVTHDRTEAMAMGDELAVMIAGRVRQSGRVADVFRHPADSDAARLLGIDTVLPGQVERIEAGLATVCIGDAELVAIASRNLPRQVYACIRAEDVIVEPEGTTSGSARNHLTGTIRSVETDQTVDRLIIDCGFELVAAVTSRSRQELGLQPGTVVTAAIKATAIHLVARA
jgi:molybdate transport system ATP-binding protein